MAYYNEQEDENDPNEDASGGVQTGPSSSVISSGQGAGAASANSPQGPANSPDKSGNFVGLRTYLDANKSQSGKLGDQVFGQVTNAVNDASSEIGTLGSRFQQKADAGQIQNINNANQDAQGIVNKAATGTVGAGPDNTDLNRFKEISTATYKGPNALNEAQDIYNPAYQKLQTAQKQADLTKNEEGTQQLLKNIYKQSDYATGQNRLDALLLNSDDNKAKLNQARAAAAPLQQNFEGAEKGASEYAAAQKALADQTRTGAQTNLSQTQAQRNADIEKLLNQMQWGEDAKQGTEDDATTGWDSEYNDLMKRLGSTDSNLSLKEDQLAQLGLSDNQRVFDKLLNPNELKNYFTKQAADQNKLISKDQQYQLDALDQLANQYGGELKNKFTQAELAGTQSKADAQAFNKNDFTARNAAMDKDYGNVIGGLQSHIPNVAQAASQFGWVQNRANNTPDEIRQTIKELESPQTIGGGYWLEDAKSGANFGGGSAGAAYRELKNWLNNYDSLSNKTVKKA